jgi:hypothetical protein
MPAKRDGRLGPITRKWKQPFSCSARKQYSKGVSHIRRNLPSFSSVLFPATRAIERVSLSGTEYFAAILFQQRY